MTAMASNILTRFRISNTRLRSIPFGNFVQAIVTEQTIQPVYVATN